MFAVFLSQSVYQLVLPITAYLCAHTQHQDSWLSKLATDFKKSATVYGSDFFTFASFWCQSLALAELTNRSPFNWLLNLPLFHEFCIVFNQQHAAKHSVFIMSTFHVINQILKSSLCTAANLEEKRETEQSLSCETNAAAVAETNADWHTSLSFAIISFMNQPGHWYYTPLKLRKKHLSCPFSCFTC